MLYEEADGDEDGLAAEIERLEEEKVQIIEGLLDCMNLLSNNTNDRELIVRKNRLESDLFAHAEKVDQLMEGVEENFRSLNQELEPALIDLGAQFDIEDLEPYFAPFLKYEYLQATHDPLIVITLD